MAPNSRDARRGNVTLVSVVVRDEGSALPLLFAVDLLFIPARLSRTTTAVRDRRSVRGGSSNRVFVRAPIGEAIRGGGQEEGDVAGGKPLPRGSLGSDRGEDLMGRLS